MDEIYEQVKTAFDFLNDKLFEGRLSKPLFLLRNEKGAEGSFGPKCFKQKAGDGEVDALAMNPTGFTRDDIDILATLAHEMTHQEQEQYPDIAGKPGKGAYHNRGWVKLMQRIGLEPFNTQNPAKNTGTTLNHKIIPGGRFEVAAKELLASGWTLGWFELGPTPTEKELARLLKQRKTTYICPNCGGKVWGKPGLNIACGCAGDKYWIMEVP